MEITITQSDSEVISRPHVNDIQNKPSGILNSEYKNVAKNNYKTLNSNTIFGKKQLAKSYLYTVNSGVEFAIKASVFMGLFLLIL